MLNVPPFFACVSALAGWLLAPPAKSAMASRLTPVTVAANVKNLFRNIQLLPQASARRRWHDVQPHDCDVRTRSWL